MEKKILIRFDDICPTMNWTQWEEAKNLMDETGVTALLGVVPDCKDPDLMIEEPRADFWEYIRDLQSRGYAIAMHGYQHVFALKADGIVTRNKISEFAGLPYEVQLEKIKRGKEILKSHGIETDVFFAPAHSYDDNTLRALSACGFKYVSDGFSSKPYMRQGIKMIPCRNGGIPSMKKRKGYVTAVVHAHEWVRQEKAGDWNKFQRLVTDNKTEIVTFDSYVNRKEGNAFFQRIVERFYLFYTLMLRPILYRIKHSVV